MLKLQGIRLAATVLAAAWRLLLKGTTVLVGVDEENDELTFEAFETPEQPPAELAEQE